MLVRAHASRGVPRRPGRCKAPSRPRQGPPDPPAATPGAPAAAPATAAPPHPLGEAHPRGPDQQAGAPDRRPAVATGPLRPALQAGHGPQVAPRVGPPQVDLPPAARRWSPRHTGRRRGVAPPVGAGNPGVGLQPHPRRTHQAGLYHWPLDGARHPPAPWGVARARAAAPTQHRARLPPAPPGPDLGLRLLHRRDAVLEHHLRALHHRARHPPGAPRRMHHEPDRCLGDPTGAADELATPGRPGERALPDPRPRQQVRPGLRCRLPERGDGDHPHTLSCAECERGRRALDPLGPPGVPRPPADHQRNPPRPRAGGLRRLLQ